MRNRNIAAQLKSAIWRRRAVGITVMVAIVATLSVIGGCKAFAAYHNWHDHLPLLCIKDSYGKVTNFDHEDGIMVTGPAEVWSPRYGIAVRGSHWQYAQFQLCDTKMELRTQGGEYTVFLQPAGWGEVDHDLGHSIGEFTICLR